MKRLFCASVLLVFLVGCGTGTSGQKEENALDAGVKVYEQAIEEVKSAKSEDELAAIVQRTYVRIDSIGVSDELESCMALFNSGDSLALQEIEPSMKAVLEAADRYMDAVTVAVAGFAMGDR